MIIESYTEHEELVDLQWRHHPIEYGKYAFFLLNPLYETKEWGHLKSCTYIYGWEILTENHENWPIKGCSHSWFW